MVAVFPTLTERDIMVEDTSVTKKGTMVSRDNPSSEENKEEIESHKVESLARNDSPKESEKTPPLEPQSYEKEKESIYLSLIEALGTQLEYYFSAENLARDSFLRSVMSSTQVLHPNTSTPATDVSYEEGKHTPIIVLSRFGKIQKIVNQYEGRRRQAAVDTKMSDTSIEQGSFFKFIPFLIRDAAILSKVLEVVVLANPYPAPMYSNGQDYHSHCTLYSKLQEEAEGSKVLDVEVFWLGVGPVSVKFEDILKVSSEETIQAKNETKKPEKCAIILRDMPSSTTEDEIRDLFSWEGCPEFKSAHFDVGNCWFVSLDGTSDEIVDTLLTLRSKKFKGEHAIKARLKTESAIKPEIDHYSIRNSGSTNKYLGNYDNGSIEHSHHYRRHNYGKHGSKNSFGYRNPYQLTPSYEKRRHGGPRGRHRDLDGNARKGSWKEPHSVPVVPPPPLEHDTHFPSLGGSLPVKDQSAVARDNVSDETPVISISDKSDTPDPVLTKEGTENTLNDASQSVPAKGNKNNDVSKISLVADSKKTVTGYAAALLKAVPAQSTPKVVSTATVLKNSGKNDDNLSKKTLKQPILTLPMQKPQSYTSTAKSSVSTVTTVTDSADKFSDSSTTSLDDKSSDSDIKPVISAWGDKKSFAAILKQEKIGGDK